MANRNTLSVSKLEDFKQWLIKDGWEIQETKGFWEVLRATKKGKKYPLIIYRKYKTIGGSENIVHLSVLDRDIGVIRAFLKEFQEKQK